VTFKITPKTASHIRPLSPPPEIEALSFVWYNRTLTSEGSIKTVRFRNIPNFAAAKLKFPSAKEIKIGNTPGNAGPLRIQFVSPSLRVPLSLVKEKLEFTSPPFTT
jgi:hypothetical protein